MHFKILFDVLRRRHFHMGALALAVALALSSTAARAQSFEETVNFLLTGNQQLSSVTFGDVMSMTNETTIVSYDGPNCKVDVSVKQGGTLLILQLLFSDPQKMQGLPKESTTDGETGVVSNVTIDFNAVAQWEIKQVAGNYGPYAYQVTLNGAGEPIMSGKQSVPVVGERPLQCTDNCPYSLPLTLNLDRFEAAMNYLYSAYCTGSSSAF